MKNEEILINLLNGSLIGLQNELEVMKDCKNADSTYKCGYISALTQSMHAINASIRMYTSMKNCTLKKTNEGLRIIENEK